VDLEHKAIERFKAASEMSLTYYDQPLIITTSGGKDSDICLELAKRAGIPYEVQHSHTTADAPQTVHHVRQQFRELELQGIRCTINYPYYKGKRISMWTLIPLKLMPPTQIMRYCCDILKEQAGKNRMITTGVRWDESQNRKNRGIYESIERDIKKRIILSNDNDDKRRLFENCKLKAKRVCNPIIDWLDRDVWDFIKSEHLLINPLYDCGFERVGCIGCPLAGINKRYFGFGMFPAYEKMYRKAFARMLEARKAKGKPCDWETQEDVFRWWMKEDPNQITFDDLEV